MSGRTVRTDHDDHLTQAHEQLTTAVEHLVSGEDWAAMLGVAARFHRYSTGRSDLSQHCEYQLRKRLRVGVQC